MTIVESIQHTQVLIATFSTWGVTAVGAFFVFYTKAVNQKLMDSMPGFAAGVIIAANFWSLLAPGIEMAQHMGQLPWLTVVIAFMDGGIPDHVFRREKVSYQTAGDRRISCDGTSSEGRADS